jgi:hypothetical protein
MHEMPEHPELCDSALALKAFDDYNGAIEATPVTFVG